MKPLVIEAKEIPYKGEYVLYMGIHDLPIDEKIIYQSAEFFICGREYDNTKEYCCCNKLEIFTESLRMKFQKMCILNGKCIIQKWIKMNL